MQVLKIQKGLQRTVYNFTISQHRSGKVIATGRVPVIYGIVLG